MPSCTVRGRLSCSASSLTLPFACRPLYGAPSWVSSLLGSFVPPHVLVCPMDFGSSDLCNLAMLVLCDVSSILEGAAPKRRIGGSGTPAAPSSDGTRAGAWSYLFAGILIDCGACLLWGYLCLSVDLRTAWSCAAGTFRNWTIACAAWTQDCMRHEAACFGALSGGVVFGLLLVANAVALLVYGGGDVPAMPMVLSFLGNWLPCASEAFCRGTALCLFGFLWTALRSCGRRRPKIRIAVVSGPAAFSRLHAARLLGLSLLGKRKTTFGTARCLRTALLGEMACRPPWLFLPSALCVRRP